MCAQQEESVSRVGEREEREDGDDFPEIRRKRLARSPRRLRGRPAPRGVRNREPENQDRREPGHGGREEDSPLVDERKLQKQGGQERSDEGARIVHGALETERPASLFRRNHVGEQRVAGGRADPLADSIREPDREHLRPDACERDERARDRSDPVSQEHERLAPPDAIRPDARADFGQRGGCLRDPFDQADGRGPGAEVLRQEAGKERIDHLGRDVGQKGDPPQGQNGSARRVDFHDSFGGSGNVPEFLRNGPGSWAPS